MKAQDLDIRFYGMSLEAADPWIAGYAAHFSKTGMVRRTVVDASEPLAEFEPLDPMAVGRPSDAEVTSIFGDATALRSADPENEIMAEMAGYMERMLKQFDNAAPPPELVFRAIEPSPGADVTIVEMSYGSENLDLDMIGRLSGMQSYRFAEDFEGENLNQRFFTVWNAGNLVRTAGLSLEENGMSFYAEGAVQSWEQDADYEHGEVTRRLPQELFRSYLAKLGMDLASVGRRQFSRIWEYRQTVDPTKAVDTRTSRRAFHEAFETALDVD